MGNLFVGIDIGCGGAKSCIVDDEGKQLAYEFKEHAIVASNSGWSETDPDEYANNIYAMLRKMTGSGQVDGASIRCVSISSAVPAMVMIDSDGKVINKAYNYLDTRAHDVVETLKGSLNPEAVFGLSAFNLEEQCIATSLLWEKANRPEDYRHIYKVLSPDGYITYRLTGKPVVNYSIAPFWGMVFDIVNRRFDMDMCGAIGLDPELLPELSPCEQVVGEVTGWASEMTGIPAGVPVIAGTCDAYAGWLAGGAAKAGDAQINLGTAAVLGVLLGDRPQFLQNYWNGIYPVDSKRNYVLFGTTTTGGYVMRHLRDNFSRYERFVEQSGGYDAYDLMNIDAARTPPGSNGLITLPHFVGARLPVYNRDARGVVFGWRMHHTKGHLIRSMMEGVAFSTRRQLEIIESNGTVVNGPIVMNEGGAKSYLWRRIYTDILGKPTAMLENRWGAPYGNALLAGVSTGYLPDFSVARNWARYVDYMEPDPKAGAVYGELYELFLSIYSHLLRDYQKLAELQSRHQWK